VINLSNTGGLLPTGFRRQSAMLFNSYIFWIFFAIVFVLYRRLGHRGQNYMLLAASYIFYGYWDWRFLFLMLFSTVVDYTAALLIAGTGSRLKRKSVLVTSIVVQLSLLGLFKYYGFFSQQLASLFGFVGIPVYVPVLKFLLPVGISFYTFQTMSYMLDVYRDEYPAEKSFVNFALFVSFFPHLVAGPLVRATKLLPQIATPRVRRPNDFREGLYYIAIGLFKKVFVGDNLAAVANSIFHANPHSLTGLECIAGIYAFAFQIYCDFSGYSSIAQGLAKWLNIDLTTNFNLPYFATSPTEFWRRWHISLSTWFRDYLYIPLLKRGPQPATRARLFASLIVVMLLSGLWHGAAWTFVLWGLYHGVLLIGYRLISRKNSGVPEPQSTLSLASFLVRVVVMFQLVCLGWLLFRAESISQVGIMLSRIVLDFHWTPFVSSAFAMILFFAGPLVIYEFWVERRQDLLSLIRIDWRVRAAIYSYCALMLLFFPPPVSNVFIYFQF
jgi:alginate O-acetyltransferase complex protein AlgI